jgi:hypothetical protein
VKKPDAQASSRRGGEYEMMTARATNFEAIPAPKRVGFIKA